jgi:hypothetical protein
MKINIGLARRSDVASRRGRSRCRPGLEALEHRRLLSFAVGGDYALASYAASVAVADFNADGRADVAAATGQGETVVVMLGKADGTLAPGPQLPALPAYNLDAGDVNGDGKPDLVATTASQGTDPWGVAETSPYLQVFSGNGDGTFAPRRLVDLPPPPNLAQGLVPYYAENVTIADVDADGKADLVVGCYYVYADPNWDPNAPGSSQPQFLVAHYLAVLRGTGGGTFATAFVREDTDAAGVAVGDLNGDGKPDLALHSSEDTITVLRGAGDGTFAAGPSYEWPGAVVVGDNSLVLTDFNGDGKLDLAAVGADVNIALGDGAGGFAPPAHYPAGPASAHSVAAGDFNGDGLPDLVAGNIGHIADGVWSDGKVSVLLNAGGTGFRAPITFPAGPNDHLAEPIVAEGDFNGDGRADVVAASFSSRYPPDPSPANLRLFVNDGQWALPPEPVSPEFLVNTTDVLFQENPAVASDAQGNFVVVWHSQDGGDAPHEVYARRYTAAGQPLGDDFRVSDVDAGYLTNPAVAMDAAGEFVVTWTSGYDIVARLYDAAGQPRGGTFPVNTVTAGEQNASSVAMDAAGNFMVAWQEDGPSYSVYARRFDASGAPRGDQFRVPTYASIGEEQPTVAMDAAGDAVVAWQSDNQAGSPFDIYAQRYDAAGAPAGGEFRVNTLTAGEQSYPGVAMDADGDFAVTWSSAEADGWHHVYVRRFSGDGSPLGPEVRAGTSQLGHEYIPVVAMSDAGEVTVAWVRSAGDVNDVYGRSFAASGEALGEQFQLGSATAPQPYQNQPALADRPDGGFVAAWMRETVVPERDIYARVFAAPAPPPAVAQVYVAGTQWTDPFKQFLAASGLGSARFGFAVPAADELNELPWVNLDRVSITFSAPVRVAADDLVVHGSRVGTYGIRDFAYDPATRTATWTLDQVVAYDRISFDLRSDAAGVTDPAGRSLDGEWAAGADEFPSGDGSPGGDFRFAVNVLPGDVNRSGAVLADDFSAVKKKFFAGTSSPGTGDAAYSIFHDVDGSGIILASDFSEVKKRFFNELPAPATVQGTRRASPSDAPFPARTARPPRRGALDDTKAALLG